MPLLDILLQKNKDKKPLKPVVYKPVVSTPVASMLSVPTQVKPVVQTQVKPVVQPEPLPDLSTSEGQNEYGIRLQKAISNSISSPVKTSDDLWNRFGRREGLDNNTLNQIREITQNYSGKEMEKRLERINVDGEQLSRLKNLLSQIPQSSPVPQPSETIPTTGIDFGRTTGINTGVAPAVYDPPSGQYLTLPLAQTDVAPSGQPVSPTNIPFILSPPQTLNLRPTVTSSDTKISPPLNQGQQVGGAIASLLGNQVTPQTQEAAKKLGIGDVVGGLLGGIFGGNKEAKIENEPIEIPDNIQDLVDYIVKQYGKEIKQPNLGIVAPNLPFGVGATPEELAAFQGIADIARITNPYLTSSLVSGKSGLEKIGSAPTVSDLLSRTAGGEFLNPESSPYLKPLTDEIDRAVTATKTQLQSRHERDLANLRNEFAGRGTLDSSLYNDALSRMKQVHDEEMQQVDSSAMQQKLGLLSDIYSRERPLQYGAEQELFERPLRVGGQELQGSRLLGELAGLPQRYGLESNEALASAGGVLRGIVQSALDKRRAEELRQNEEFFRRLGFPLDLAASAAQRTVTTVTPPTDYSNIFQLLGAAAAPYFQRRQTYTPPFVNINTGSNLGASTLGAMLPAGAIIGGIY